MDLQQAKSLINKINALFKGIESGDSMLSAIERDLMLSYIRQLYEEFLNVRADMPAAKSATRSAEGESAQPDFEVIAPKAPAPEPPQKPSKPKIIEIPDSLKDLEPAAPPPPKPKIVKEEAPPPKPEPKPEPPRRPVQESKPEAPNKQPSPEHEEEYHVLFEFKAARELSEKLSERRVDDLGKALAINDRLLYMNELFGKDANMLNESLKLLNKFDSLEEAKSLLINLAERYDWLEEEKVPVAQGFIKLVRRKYI